MINIKTLEIVFGDTCSNIMKKSSMNKNTILTFNLCLNVGDISRIDDNILNIIVNNIDRNNKIRVWTSKKDIYSYLLMLYISSIIEIYNYDLYVTYSDEYNIDYISPRVMNEKELENLEKIEHKLSKNELMNNTKIWKKLVKENSELRVIDNGIVKSVSMSYYDEIILETLNELGKVKIINLVATLIGKIYVCDSLIISLIERLIDENKIVIEKNSDKYFESIVDLKRT
mgnify:FL=1